MYLHKNAVIYNPTTDSILCGVAVKVIFFSLSPVNFPVVFLRNAYDNKEIKKTTISWKITDQFN